MKHTSLFQQEQFILSVQEAIAGEIERQEINYSTLARKIGVTKGCLSQWMSGEANLTLRTVSDIFYALGCKPELLVERHRKIKS